MISNKKDYYRKEQNNSLYILMIAIIM